MGPKCSISGVQRAHSNDEDGGRGIRVDRAGVRASEQLVYTVYKLHFLRITVSSRRIVPHLPAIVLAYRDGAHRCYNLKQTGDTQNNTRAHNDNIFAASWFWSDHACYGPSQANFADKISSELFNPVF